MINEIILSKVLKEYDFELTKFGKECISFQIELLYGEQPTLMQIEDVVRQNKISYINDLNKK